LKLAVTGFSNSGKSTIFNALTGLNLETTIYPTSVSAVIEPHHGMVKVPDKRLDRLSSVYKKKKTVHATIDYIDYAGIMQSSSGGDPAQNAKVFDFIRDTDAVVHVVREFEDESIIHPMVTIDPVRDVKSFETELVFGDLELVEKRLERIDLDAKKGKGRDEAGKHVLLKCKEALENERALRTISFNEDEKKLLSGYQYLTTLPEIIVINTDEQDLHTDRVQKIQKEIDDYFSEKEQGDTPLILPVCGKIETEIAQLPAEDAKAFLEDLGIAELAMHRLCRASYEALDLISFFTIGRDEVRAWTINNGTIAQKAASKVHSDIERGFIRAETVSYDDFQASEEDMVKAKEKGLVRQEGKTYVVKDGDIIHFKFNV
jgi:GTP-binding protein YchF